MTLQDPNGVPYPEEVQALVSLLEIDEQTYAGDALIKALESVRGIEHRPNVLWFNSITSPQVNTLIATLLDAAENHAWFRITIDRGELKIKAGEQSWSPPFRTEM